MKFQPLPVSLSCTIASSAQFSVSQFENPILLLHPVSLKISYCGGISSTTCEHLYLVVCQLINLFKNVGKIKLTSDITTNLVTAEFCVPSKSLVAVTTIVLTSPTVASQGTLNVAVIEVLESSSMVILEK